MIIKEQFGRTAAGAAVDRYILASPAGLRAAVVTYGAALQLLEAPDADGRPADVAPGFSSLADYEGHPAHFGAVIGRTCGRIRRGVLPLGGRAHQLPQNAKGHHLHGGERGFDRRVWEAAVAPDALTLSIASPDGDEGYPGELRAAVTYRWAASDCLEIAFAAHSAADTVCNLTTHAYWNLAGHDAGDILGHYLRIAAGRIAVMDAEAVPTGVIADAASAGRDFRRWRQLRHPDAPERAAVDSGCYLQDAPGDLSQPAAEVWEPTSGRLMQVFATQPALQYYGGYLVKNCPPGKNGAAYGAYCGLCLEPQALSEGMRHPALPSPFLAAGKTYRHTIQYKFSARRTPPWEE